MKTRSLTTGVLALILSAGTTLAQSAPSTTSPTTPPATPATPAQPETKPVAGAYLPSGKEILAKYIEATGGRAAYEKIKTRVSEGTIEMKPMGLKGTLLMKQQAPGSMTLSLELPQVGNVVQGNNGTHAWESNPMQGARLLDGKELEESNRQAMLAAELNPDLVYASINCVGIEKVGESECYKVEAVTKGGSKRTSFYAKDTGLLVRLDMVMESPMGEVKASSIMSDYREADGIKIPFVTTLSIDAGMKIEQVITITKVTHNTELPSDTFTPPKDVQELIDDKAKKPASPETPAAPTAPATPGEKK
jgi:hypothetical protein